MIESIDRRSYGKACATKTAQYSRRVYKRLEAEGFCNKCGKVPVTNRKTCIACVDKQGLADVKRAIRHTLAKILGVPIKSPQLKLCWHELMLTGVTWTSDGTPINRDALMLQLLQANAYAL